MEFKDREARTKCYEARDAYFECVEKHSKDKHPKLACKQPFSLFEKCCGSKWTEHFVRRRDYLKFKEKLEKEGLESLDEEKFKPK